MVLDILSNEEEKESQTHYASDMLFISRNHKTSAGTDSNALQQVTKSPEELKERVKFITSLQTISKDDTLKMRLKHLG